MRKEPSISEGINPEQQQQSSQTITRSNEQQLQVIKKQSNIYLRLVEACKLKDLASIRLLLKEHPEFANKRDKQDRSLLHYAVIQIGEQQDSIGAIKCFDFLQEQADQRLWSHQDRDGLSLLHLAVISANDALVEHLAEGHPLALRRPLVGSLDRERHSPLHWAVITNSLTSVRVLTRTAGVGLAHEPDLNGATPLHYATQTGDFPRYRRQLRRLLAGGESMGGTCEGGGRGGEETGGGGGVEVESGSSQILEFLLNLDGIQLECEDRDKRTPLLWAASSGNWIAVDLLLEHGANPLSYDINRLGALHCAASRGHLRCLESLLSSSYSEIGGSKKRLEPDQKDNLNCTALFYAVLGSNVDCIEILLERGADPNWQDSKGRTASHFAALRGQLSALKLLRERGANLWLANKLGDLPLHYAVKSGRLQVVRWLLECSPYEQAVNAINNLGRAPIHLAVQRNDPALLTYLLECSPNLAQLAKVRTSNSTADHSNSSVKVSSHQRYETALDAAERLGRSECTQILLDARAPRAVQVLSERAQVGRALFKTLDTESPIGFETSCSEALDQGNSRSCSDDLTQAGSSPAAHNLASSCSPASIYYGANNNNNNNNNNRPISRQLDFEQTHASPASTPVASFPNGVAANSSTTLRCKIRPTGKSTTLTNQKSRVASSASQEFVTNVNVYTSTPCPRCMSNNGWQPALIAGCSCAPSNLPALTYEFGSSEATTTCAEEEDDDDGELDNQGRLVEEELSDSEVRTHLPNLLANQNQLINNPCESEARGDSSLNGIQQRRANPVSEPSRLPVILSEREQSSNSSSPVNEQQQQLTQAHDQEKLDDEDDACQELHRLRTTSSPAQEVPRFDRFSRETTKLPNIRRSKQARSPVAEYIHSTPLSSGTTINDNVFLPRKSRYQHTRKTGLGVTSPRKSQQQQHYQQYPTGNNSRLISTRQVDRLSTPQAGQDRMRSKSQSRSSDFKAQPYGISVRGEQQHSRSSSRQTIIKTRRLSVDSVELASRVEKAIRKYKQETKLFEELQNLKRSQIRSGRANEALLVKRLVENLRTNTNHLLGLDSYSGPYTYKAYERFLYDQLRKLSLSNRGKLSPTRLPPATTQRQGEQKQPHFSGLSREYHHPQNNEVSAAELERLNAEDASAEQELRRIIAGKSGRESSFDLGLNDSSDQLERDGSDESIFVLESTGALEDIRVKGKSGEGVERESVHKTSGKRDYQVIEASSTLDSEPSELLKLQDIPRESDERVIDLQEEANQLSSAILVDALGNISRVGSPRKSRVNCASYISTHEDFEQQQQEKKAYDEKPCNEKESKSDDESVKEIAGSYEESKTQDGRDFTALDVVDGKDDEDVGEDDKDKDKDYFLSTKSDAERKIERDDEEKGQVGEQMMPSGGRRRSVINIGDKIDIIYHDVGIEIEKVPDRKPSEEEDDQGIASLLQQKRNEEEVGNVKLEGVEEEEEELPIDEESQKEKEETKDENSATEKEEKTEQVDSFEKPKDNYLLISKSKTALTRRASSPPVYGVREAEESRNKRDNLKRSTSVGRSSIIGSDVGGHILAGDSNSKERENSRKSEMEKISENMDEVEEVEMEKNEVISDNKRLKFRDNLSPNTLKRRKERSQVPAGKYEPQVPLQEIKLRWAEIKANERSIRNEAGTGVDSATDENYTLLYEINKDVLLGLGTEKSRQQQVAQRKRTHWCRRRIARIVDVRTVKRTLSLPESLIYSNDLLKRFDIFKL